MTYIVSSGTLNSSIPYHTISLLFKVFKMHLNTSQQLIPNLRHGQRVSSAGAVAVDPVLGTISDQRRAVQVPSDARRRTSGYVGTECQAPVAADDVRRACREGEFHRRGGRRRRHLDDVTTDATSGQ